MTREQREAILRSHMEGENVHDYDAVMATFSHPRYELIGTGAVFDGDAQVRRYFEVSRTPFPDQHNELIALHHTDDGILTEFWLMGTHTGPLNAGGEVIAPTGKTFRVRMAALFLFDDKGIIAERVWFDQLSILAQLGINVEIAK
jgi:ketosteroid isomerase-like protein